MNFPSPIKYTFCLFVLTATVASYGMEQNFSESTTPKSDCSVPFMWVSVDRNKNGDIKKVKITRQKNGRREITERMLPKSTWWHSNSHYMESFIKEEQQKFFAEEGQGPDKKVSSN